MEDIKKRVLALCGYKIAWLDLCHIKIVRVFKGFSLTDFEKKAISKWAESESKKVIFK